MTHTHRNIKSVVDRDGAVLLDLSRSSITILDATGSYVWQRLLRGLTNADIVRELAEETGAESAMIARDVDMFVEQLRGQDLLAPDPQDMER